MQSDKLKELYTGYVGTEPESVIEMPASGSNRRYFRMTGPQSIIGVIGECVEENRAFLYMDKHFLEKGLPVPRVYAQSEDQLAYIQ